MKKFIGYLFCLLFVLPCFAQNNAPITLQVKQENIVVNGKPSLVYRLKQPDGTLGITATKGDNLHIIVENTLTRPTSIHWHGIILPYLQDGVPYVTQPPISPGEKREYHFKLVQAGTFWMHSHFRLQEQKLMAAPFIIKDPTDKNNFQEVVMFLEDFSFKEPKAIYKELRCKNYLDMDMSMPPNHKMNMSMDMSQHKMMNMDHGMDLNDVTYDAFLANERTLENPRVVRIQPNSTVRLRVINGSATTNFYINVGTLKHQLIAVDGSNIKPIQLNPVQLGTAQRADILVTIPSGEGAYPILAQGEGTNMQTGIILATPNAKIPSLNSKTATTSPAFDYSQEKMLSAQDPYPPKKVDRSILLELQGDMMKYVWKINNQIWPYIKPLMVTAPERVELVFKNETSMAHPMHLHGHVFQVAAINDQPLQGAKRDTILVLPQSTVKVQFNADNPGVWMVHCHNLYHAAAGMMTKLLYEGITPPTFTLEQQKSMSGSLWFTNKEQCLMN